jgi:hypothetical protein
VNQAASHVTWNDPAPITFGTPLSPAQLNATADVPGTFVYQPGAGTVLQAGTTTLHVTFTPTSPNYATTTASASITVNQATPVITWANPAAITYGTPLSATQLNATANQLGSFAYTPAAGTVLSAGPHMLSVTFTPSDTRNYKSASATASITVNKATLTVAATNLSRYYGQSNPALTYSVTGLVNDDGVSAYSGAPALSTTATSASHAGSYPITVAIGTLTSANYRFELVNGTLTVRQAPTTLTARTFLVTVTTSPLGLTTTVGTVSATLVNNATGHGAAGQRIVFRTPAGTSVCSAVTNASGVATCRTSVLSIIRIVAASGYVARFTATPDLAGATATAPIIRAS